MRENPLAFQDIQPTNVQLQVQLERLQLDQQAAAAAYQAFEQQTTAGLTASRSW